MEIFGTLLFSFAVMLIAFVSYITSVVYRQQLKTLHYDIYLEYIPTDKLGPYYVSLSNKINEVLMHFDAQNGPLILGADGIRHYSAIKHAHIALCNYEQYLNTSDVTYKDEFMKVVESIILHGKIGAANGLVYEHTISNFKDQQVPWLHAMAQGQVIAVLCRAFQESRDNQYLELAKRAAIPFTRDISDGGVRSIDPIRGVFYEEYAYHEPDKQHHTLNGMISALMGLFDLWKITKQSEHRELFDIGVKTIRENLMAYAFPFCSSYDLRHEHGDFPMMQPRYNSVHVAHLKILSAMTNDPYFAMVSDKWSQTLKSRFNRLCYFIFYLNWKWKDLSNDRSNIGLRKMIGMYRIRLTHRLLGRSRPHNAIRPDSVEKQDSLTKG